MSGSYQALIKCLLINYNTLHEPNASNSHLQSLIVRVPVCVSHCQLMIGIPWKLKGSSVNFLDSM